MFLSIYYSVVSTSLTIVIYLHEYCIYSIVCSTLNIGEINSRLPDEFKVVLTSNLKTQFEFEFHSASHNIMMEVVLLLRTVCSHLIKV